MDLPRPVVTAALLAAALALMPLVAPAATGEAGMQRLDRIVAVVAEGVILESELETEIARVRARLEREDRSAPSPEVLRRRVLEELVLERIQLQRAEQRGISIDDEAVNEALRNMAADRDTDLEGLRQGMEAQGVPFEELRADVRTQLIISRLRQRVVASQVQVSEQEIEDYLSRIERSSNRQAEYRLRHILVGLPSDASTGEVAEARTRAEDLVEQLRDGDAGFAALAQEVSDGPQALSGGDLGWRRRADLPALFLDAIDDMEPGAVSGPLRSPNGFHVLKLVERRGGASETITQTRARHILLRDDDQPRERLAELRRRLRAGAATFAELARAHSDDRSSARNGGDLGWFGPGEMTPAFEQVVEGLDPGQVSEPFRTPHGWHIVEVLERRERTDVEQYRRARVRRALYRRQVEEETQRWLRGLRDETYVELRLDE